MDVSIVLPTFNEAGNIARIIAKLCHQMEQYQKDFEILVMDDNSKDDTVQEVRDAFYGDERIRVIVRDPADRGLARSIREGIEKSKGSRLLIMDSDFNHDPDATGLMVHFSDHFDIISGSRFTTGGGMDSRFRWVCSLIFNLWIRILLSLPTQDNLAGFYCIHREKLNELDLDRIFQNYGDYFFRMLYQIKQKKFSILEIPVWYRNRSHGVSKTPFLRTLLLYTKESIKLRFADKNF
jgi:dolichol-phosphate mannosyltransferase